jgi:RNA polymerase subunit RPABC4/transcription elongation factor Spt4
MALVVKPDPAAIGKAYRVLQPKIVKLLENRSADEIKKALDKGHLQLGVEGQIVTIEPSMVRFEKAMPVEVVRVSTAHGELYLDLRITPELQAEAYAREVIRRIQQMRKEIDLEVDDFIEVIVKTNKDFARMLEGQKEFMARETRSRKFTFTDGAVDSEYVVEWNDVDGHSVTVGVTPLHMSEALRDFTRIPGITVAKAVALFDAGYKSLAALRAATKQELAQIEGLQSSDAVRILDALAAKKEVPLVCPTCGASVSASARRCSRCGEPVTTKTTPCPRCKASIPPGADKCPVCGFVLSTAPVGTPSRIACIACGELIPAGSTECPSCGAPQGRVAAIAARILSEDEPPPLLKDSSSYLVEEAAPDEAYRLFQIAQKAGKPGMAITRIFPQKVRERLGGSDLPILWLSNVGKEDSVRPKDLEKLSLAVEQFLTREKGVILLDAIEYLVTNNNFITVLRLVQSIRDQVAINNGVFLVSVNPSALDPHQLTLLEREVDRVIAGSSVRSSADTSKEDGG